MNAPGKGMLKVTSILLIIFGAIAVFFNLFTVACSAALTSVGSQLTEELGSVANDAVAAVSSWALILSIAALILGVAELVFGMMCALYLVDIVVSTILVSFPVLSVVGFVLPILYIVGGNMNKKAVAAPAA
jgi:hypothetical protein